ncbi:hypothetical protein F5Y18DRAFT_432405 [Xylariaceae sp. FL1019]|nr:hypothetical protein F5Y18DRAFT_432405 [Xylariaceae sp. FL1019]
MAERTGFKPSQAKGGPSLDQKERDRQRELLERGLQRHIANTELLQLIFEQNDLRDSHNFNALLDKYAQLKIQNETVATEISEAQDHVRKLQSDVASYETRIHLADRTMDTLQADISAREQQILSLRPYRSELNRQDAQQRFQSLRDDIMEWVQNWTDDMIDDRNLRNQSVYYVRQDPRSMAQFKYFLASNGDIALAISTTHHEQDVEQRILAAYILRFVISRIFSGPICTVPDYIRLALEQAEKAMMTYITPRPDIFAIRSWRAQSYHAVLNHPDHGHDRAICIASQAKDLSGILSFINIKANPAFLPSISDQIIEPSIALRESFQAATEDYYLESTPSLNACNVLDPSLSLDHISQLLDSLECVNIADAHRLFSAKEVDASKITEEYFREHFFVVCPVSPALLVREPIREDTFRLPITLCKERVLIEWTPPKDTNAEIEDATVTDTWLSTIIRISGRSPYSTRQG